MWQNALRLSVGGRAIQRCRPLSTLIDVSVNDKTGVAVVTLKRTPVNSINLELACDLQATIKELETNRSRGMILTSILPTIFSAGLDILEMHRPNKERIRDFWTALQNMWLTLYGASFPTAAAINGHSPAGGCLLACSCEYRVMVKSQTHPYTIGLNETKLGIVAPQWFIASYCNVLPRRVAEGALIAGTLFTVDNALAVGLVDEIASDKVDAIAKAEKWMSSFKSVSPDARTMTKLHMRGADLKWLKDNRKADLDQFLKFIESEKVQQGLGIYIESLKKKVDK